MTDDELKKVLGIRYVKLHFTVESAGDSTLPKYKASAIRGGIGEMLLRASCIRDRECECCDFLDECLVQRIMYPRMKIQPAFMTNRDSTGYVIECEDYHEEIGDGDAWKFNILLFGKVIAHFAQILDAVFRLGEAGIGRHGAQYRIREITNSSGHPILKGNDVVMRNYRVGTVGEYVKYRLDRDSGHSGDRWRIKFQTPLCLKSNGVFLDFFDPKAVIAAIRRRIYILDCLEGIEAPQWLDKEAAFQVVRERHSMVSVPRYSNHRNEKMVLKGIEGDMETESIPGSLLPLLYAGELVHIGKNTSFGFGRYKVMCDGKTSDRIEALEEILK